MTKAPHETLPTNPLEEVRRLGAIFHGPQNIGGIGRRLSAYERSRGIKSDFITFYDFTMQQDHHLDLAISQVGGIRKGLISIFFFLTCLIRYDTFVFYFGKTFLPFNLDLIILKLFRKRTAMVYTGSEIRRHEIECRWNPYHKDIRIGLENPSLDRKKRMMGRWHLMWIDMLFAQRDLCEHLAGLGRPDKIRSDIWLNNLLDLQALTPKYPSRRDRPVIVHAPSHKGIKGTEKIEAALKSLEREGLTFDYRQIHNMAHAEAMKEIAEADIVVDQLYFVVGHLCFEAMALGKPVVSFMPAEVAAKHIPGCPVLHATVDDIADRLRELLKSPDERERLGRAGRAYAQAHVEEGQVGEAYFNALLRA